MYTPVENLFTNYPLHIHDQLVVQGLLLLLQQAGRQAGRQAGD
jgi:hypothetical protein